MSPVRFIMFSFLQAFYTPYIKDWFFFLNGGRIGDAFEGGMTKTAYILLDFEKSSYQYLLSTVVQRACFLLEYCDGTNTSSLVGPCWSINPLRSVGKDEL